MKRLIARLARALDWFNWPFGVTGRHEIEERLERYCQRREKAAYYRGFEAGVEAEREPYR